MTMKLAIIVAMDEHRLIGKNNDLPWKLSADLQFFRRTTMGKPIVMGRNTHESIGRPLPGRQNIVITSQADYQAEGCDVVNSLENALALCRDAEEVMVMGGASLYEQTVALADKLYLTRVHANLDGDTWFPEWSERDWQLISSEPHQADEKNQYDYSFELYQRVTS
jgi:dihydrofolate reductase